MDELLLSEDDMFNADPEDLPRRLLTNFAIYNSEVGLKSKHIICKCPAPPSLASWQMQTGHM